LLALRVIRRYKPTASYHILPQIALLIEAITGVRYPDRKAVIGRNIFNMESGIHVDGILKKPQMYEPFLPELVGRSRHLIVGKHSGRKSIAAKLRELGYASTEFDVAHLLSAVRAESVCRMTSLTDEEFRTIAERYRL
jgi:homocitrate synthase NifV